MAAYDATTRPPGRKRRAAASSTSRPPPPTNTRSGSGRSASASGASPSTTRTAVPRALARNSLGERSRAYTSRLGARSAHSRATLPLPAPTSHTTPLVGRASLLSTTARTSALVIIPARWPYARSGRPNARHLWAATPSSASRTTTDSGSQSPWASPARSVRVTSSSWPPRREQTATAVCRAPWSRRARPMDCGGASGLTSTAALPAAAAASAASSMGRPWADTTTASSHGMPRRANARETDEGAGWTSRRSGPKRSARGRTMPKNPGSPDANTHTRPGSPATVSRTPARSPNSTPVRPTAARWRGAPTTRSACSTARWASLARGSTTPTTAMPSGTRTPGGRVRSTADGAWLPGSRPVTVCTAPDSHRLPVYDVGWTVAAGHDAGAVEVDHDDVDVQAPAGVLLAIGRRPAAEEGEGLEVAGDDAHLEEVAGGLGGGRRLDDRLGCLGQAGGFGHELAVDLRPVEVRHHHAGGELGDLARHPHEEGTAHPRVGRPAQGDPGEVAHLDEAHLRQVGTQAEGHLLGPTARRQHHGRLALGGRHVDLLGDRRPVGGRGEGAHDSRRAQDRDAADDAEPGVGCLGRHRLTARDLEGHDERALGNLGDVRQDHASRDGIDGGRAHVEPESRLGHRAHARPCPQVGPVAGRRPLDRRCHAGAIRAVGVVARILDDDTAVGALGLDGEGD